MNSKNVYPKKQRFKMMSASELMALPHCHGTIDSVLSAISVYSPEYMHGRPKKQYIKFLEKLHPRQFPDCEDDAGTAYAFLIYLKGLKENDVIWHSFLREAFEEVMEGCFESGYGQANT